MKSLIYGNGESRQVWDVTKKYKGFTTWGCNAIYRDAVVDNLVAIDYGIQQEIYESDYAITNRCHFADWAKLEDFDPEFLKMNYTPMDIHETKKNDGTSCVVQGKERETARKTPLTASMAHIRRYYCLLARGGGNHHKIKLAAVAADEFGVFAGDTALFRLAQKAAPAAVVIEFRAAVGEDH